MYEARMFGCSNEAQGRVLALACIAERKNPLELVRTYHIIDGKLSMRADAMLAEFRKLGGKVRWTATGDDGKEAKAIFSFEDVDTEIGYSIEDAKRAGLVKDKSAWVKDPGAMLRARVTSKAVRMLAPEIVAGYYTPEEIDDVADGRDAKAAVVVDAESIAKAAATRAKKNGKANADTKAGDVIDAEFVAVETTATTTPATTVADAPATPPKTGKGSDLDKPCLVGDAEQIKSLFKLAGLSPEQQTKALAKRGAQVVRNLTRGQADELIATLRGVIKKMNEATAATTVAEQPPFDTSTATDNPSASELDTCSADQVEAIKKLIAEIGDENLVRKIADKLAEIGVTKIAELSWRDAVTLHRALSCKAMEQFFEASLTKPTTTPATTPEATEQDAKN